VLVPRNVSEYKIIDEVTVNAMKAERVKGGCLASHILDLGTRL
jgi:hypothetical protein